MTNLPSGFSEEAPVLTRRGILPIREVVINDAVLTHEGRWRTVTATAAAETDSIQIGHIITTPNQQFLASNLKTTWHQNPLRLTKHLTDPAWTVAERTAGLLLAHPTRVPVTDEEAPKLSYETLGRFLAGGVAQLTAKEEKELLPLLTNQTTIPGWMFSLSILKREIILDTYLSLASNRGSKGQSITVPAGLHQTSIVQLLAETLGYQTTLQEQDGLWNLTLTKTVEDAKVAAHRTAQHRWVKQSQKVTSGLHIPVHNLTVEEDNSYTVWNVVVAGQPVRHPDSSQKKTLTKA